MKSFARATRLPNISGRGDYIANPEKQECIVAASAKVDWKPYHDYEMANQKTKLRNNEGRELVIQLPNEWAELPQAELRRRGDELAQTVAGKGRDVQWAMHWNKDHTNFHIHVIFSERQKEKNPGVWDRDVYLTDDGKVARRKADRAREPDGSFKPPVHRKGEVKEPFTAKDPKFATQKWLREVKLEVRSKLEEMGVKFEKPGLLTEYHEGKGSDSKLIKAKNQLIRATNEAVVKLEQDRKQPLTPNDLKTLRKYGLTALRKGEVLKLTLEGNQLRVGSWSLKEHRQAMAEKPAPAAPQQTEKPAPAEPVQKAQKDAPAAPAGEREVRAAPAPKPSQKLRAAFDDLKAAQDKIRYAELDLSEADKLPFWNRQKKPKKEAAKRELYAARQECQDAFDRVVSFGVSTVKPLGMGVQMSGRELDFEDMKYLSSHVERKIKELEDAELHDRGTKASTWKETDEEVMQERKLEKAAPGQEQVQKTRKSQDHEER